MQEWWNMDTEKVKLMKVLLYRSPTLNCSEKHNKTATAGTGTVASADWDKIKIEEIIAAKPRQLMAKV